jgi:putative porin
MREFSGHRFVRGAAAFCVFALVQSLFAAPAESELDQFLDLFIKKGFVTPQEVERVKAESAAMKTNNGKIYIEASKWKISEAIKSVELFGDIRLRYEDRSVEDPAGGKIDLQRFRYAARVGLRGELFDDFYYGLRVDTSANPRSPFVTFGSSSSGTPYQGPFGKSTSGFNVGQVYLGWRAASWVEFTAGRMQQPLYTTAMVWDGDINPEGMAEKFKYTVGEADFFATFGQFLYQDTNPTESSRGYFNFAQTHADLPFLLAWQVGVDYHLTPRLSLKIAPVLYNYIGHGVNTTSGSSATPDFSGTFVGQGTTNGISGARASFSGYPGGPFDGFVANQTGINNLMVLEIPGELNLKLDRISLRLFGDYAQNLQGTDRARAAFAAQSSTLLSDVGLARIPSPQTHDTKAYQAGFAVGSANKLGLATGATVGKRAWELRAYWQHTEQYALDPNLVDSDIFEGRENLEGLFAALAYGFTANTIGTVRYGYASRINKKLGTGGSNQDLPQMNPIDKYTLLQFDLTFKF